MNSEFFKLNKGDFIRGLVVVVISAIITVLQQMLTAHGLDVQSYDWKLILDVALSSGGAYLMKNLLSTDTGKVFGKIG